MSERHCYQCKHKYVDVDEFCLCPESDHERLGMRPTREARHPGQPCGPEGRLFEPVVAGLVERPCEECRYQYDGAHFPCCSHPKARAEYDKRNWAPSTAQARYPDNPCGMEGKLFEAKEENHESL